MPSKENKRDLYIATSMGELQKKSEIKPTSSSARILVKTADNMFREAEKVELLGDEEKAFVLYMRYFNIVKQVKMNADYKKNKQFYDNLLGQKNQVHAIEQAEKLAESLKERYELKEAEAVANKFAALEACGKRLEKDLEDSPTDNKVNGSAVEAESSTQHPSTSTDTPVTQPNITPAALCSLLRDSNAQLILMDTRPAADFMESHVNHTACISVPQEVLTPGTTVPRIEGLLPQESLPLWKQRGNMDHIILLDWSSKLDAVTIGTPLRTLKDALFKYDSTVIIKSEPLVLEGGYDQWLLVYPTMTTNARVLRPAVSNVSSTIALLDFDYPDFEDVQPAKPASESLEAKPGLPSSFSDLGGPSAVDAISKVPLAGAGSIPQYNRALKPKSGPSIVDQINKTGELNNTRNLNIPRSNQTGEGVNVLSNNLYPSVVVAPKKPDKNTNIMADKTKAFEDSNRAVERQPPIPFLSATSSVDRQQEAEERAKLQALEDKRKREEKALADIMRKKRHMEQDLKEMQQLTLQESQAKAARDDAVKEEDAERKRLAEVEKLRLERKRKEMEAQREKDQLDIMAKEKEVQEMKERARREQEEKEEEEKQAAFRAAALAADHAEKLQQEKAEADRLQQEKAEQAEKLRLQEEVEQARQKAAKLAQQKREEEMRAAAALRVEEERKLKEEEQRQKEEEMKKVEEDRKEKERAEAASREEAARKARKMEEEKRAAEAAKTVSASSVDSIRHAQESKMIPSPSLPTGWEKRLDNTTRRYYYIDHNRGKTQWEPPAVGREPQRTDTYKTKLKEEPAVSSRGLSRSHSSPDIMKQLADEAKGSGKPVYDRTSKPSLRMPETAPTKAPVIRQVARRRDLNPTYGNVGSALTGLRNLGNTCYMNSTVQCLSNTTPLVSYFLTDVYLNDINRDSVQGMHGEVVDEFAVVVKALWAGQYRCITPRDLKTTVGQYNPMFAGYQQQDSQEFLTFLLDGLHEGLNEVKKRPQIPDQENDNVPDRKAAELAWENHKRLHRSIIVELFQGQLKSTLMCRTCHKQSVTFQAFMYISLPIPSSSRCTLRDCFRAFLQPEMMTGSCKWKCPQCRVERDAEKKIDIWKLPHILLIGLNRFVSDGMWMQKKTSYVDFPINDLDLEEFTLGPKQRSRYGLYGVSNHYGTMEGGHYTAFCRNPCNRKWHKFDDHEVYEMSQSDVKTSAAFVLYYTSIPLNTPQFKPQL